MPNVKVTLVRSTIGQQASQIATVKALGLKKIRQTVVKNDTPQIRGMLKKVAHLVMCENE